MKNWLLFLIIPSIFNATFIKASNYIAGYNHTASIFVLFGFLWLVGFFAYYFSPNKSMFLTLSLLGLITASNFLKVVLSNIFQQHLLPPIFLIPAVLIFPYIGLWKARKSRIHFLDN